MKKFVNGIVKNAGELGIIRLAAWSHGSDFEKAPGFKSAGNNLKGVDLKVNKRGRKMDLEGPSHNRGKTK